MSILKLYVYIENALERGIYFSETVISTTLVLAQVIFPTNSVIGNNQKIHVTNHGSFFFNFNYQSSIFLKFQFLVSF